VLAQGKQCNDSCAMVHSHRFLRQLQISTAPLCGKE